jgi:hypothetical protein
MAGAKCPRCGSTRTNAARYCSNCAFDFWAAAAGSPQPSQPEPPGSATPPPATPPPPQSRVWTQSQPLNVLVVVLVSGLFLWWLWIRFGDSDSASGPTATPSPIAETEAPDPWVISIADDPTYTTETAVGGSIEVVLTLSNGGSGASESTELQFGGIDDHADIVGCSPPCMTSTFLGDVYAELEGVPAGGTTTIQVEFVATAVGAARWSICVYDSVIAGDQVYCGNATTVVR